MEQVEEEAAEAETADGNKGLVVLLTMSGLGLSTDAEGSEDGVS